MIPYSLLQPPQIAYFSSQPCKPTPHYNLPVSTHNLFFKGKNPDWRVIATFTVKGATLQHAVNEAQAKIDELVLEKRKNGFKSFKFNAILLKPGTNELKVTVHGAKEEIQGRDDTTLSGKRAAPSGEGSKGQTGIQLP
jgi:hypothetical protein